MLFHSQEHQEIANINFMYKIPLIVENTTRRDFYMKKKSLLIISAFLGILFLVGCDNVMNTPTKRVEEFLSNYQTASSDVLTQLDNTLTSEATLNDTQKTTYKDIMKKQYQALTYTIKDEIVDGDDATVKVEIEVYDYNKSIKDADSYLLLNQSEFYDDSGIVDNIKFMDYKLDQMNNVSDKVKYTIDFSLTKKDNAWTLNDISEIDRQKIHGIYSY